MRQQISDTELELLGILQEECAEVIQIISKIRRFGLQSYNPYIEGANTNEVLLMQELGDVLAIVGLLQDSGLLQQGALDEARLAKLHKVVKFMKHPPT
jgi:hypothetical protein